MEKIAVTVPVWGRLELTNKFYEGIKRASEDFYKHGYELILYVAGSEEEHLELALSFGAKYLHVQNKPVSYKMQKLVEFAMKDKWDYWMTLGSDDFFIKDGANFTVEQLKSGANSGMPKSMYIFSTQNRNRGFEFKNCGRIGAGRWYKREVLDRVKDGVIFPSNVNRLLDYWSETLIYESTGVKPVSFDNGSYLADVKTSENINSFDRTRAFRKFEDHFALNLLDYVPEFKDESKVKLKVS